MNEYIVHPLVNSITSDFLPANLIRPLIKKSAKPAT